MIPAKPADVDDDVLALADRLRAAAIDYRRLEVQSWRSVILTTVILVVCGTVHAIPAWTVILSGIVTGHFIGRAITARRRCLASVAKSARLRVLVSPVALVAAPGDPRRREDRSACRGRHRAIERRASVSRDPQPMQPVVKDGNGGVRFRGNAIVRYIVDHVGDVIHPGAPAIDPATGKPFHQGKLDLDKLAMMDFPQEDREQFAQLMGYSVAGYHELSYVSDESCAEASVLADEVVSGAGGCRDAGCSVHGGPLFDEDGRRIA